MLRFRLPPIWLSLLVPAAYFTAASLGLFLIERGGGVATLWPAGAVLFTALVRRPRSEWPYLLLTCLLADLSSNVLTGSELLLSTGIGAIATSEAMIAALLFLGPNRSPRLTDYSDLARFAFAIVTACAVSALLGSLWMLSRNGVSPLTTFPWWLSADLVGLMILAPLLLTWTDGKTVRGRWPGFWVEMVILTIAVPIVLFESSAFDPAYRFILFPLLLLIAFRLGLPGATAGTTLAAFSAMWLSIRAYRPELGTLALNGDIRVIQAFVLTLFFSTVIAAIALERDTLMRRALADQQSALEGLNRRLFEQARLDSLTETGTRLKLKEDLELLSSRPIKSLHAIMCDVDHFKAYNDSYGHLEGDDALRRVAAALSKHFGEGANLYRYGGEEFLAILEDCSSDDAFRRSDLARREVERLAIPHRVSPFGRVTVSMGIAPRNPARQAGSTEWLKEADGALYEAKRRGRNRVALAPATGASNKSAA